MDPNHKRILVLSVSSLLLLAMVVAAAIGLISSNENNGPEISTSNKAIKTLCDSVDYQDSCVKGLSSKEYNETDDPKELVKIGMEVTMKYIKGALTKSVTLEELEKDPRSKEALRSCSELAQMSINDLERSFKKFSDLDISELNIILADLKVWLSGAMTSEETCLDGFENATGEASDKMREALKLGMQMTTNSLAMVNEIAIAFAKLNNEKPVNNRRLLSVPNWLDPMRRKIIESNHEIKADVVVAKDGSGKYKTIKEALKDIPKSSNKSFVMHIKEGVYEEKVEIFSNMTHLIMIGDGPNKTKITGKLNRVDGTTTYQSATVAIRGDYFIAKDIGFENSAGSEKEQAVALRVSADKAIFHNCRMDGYQDTLYTHAYRQFYRDCVITGTIDFVFGDAAVLFQNCTFLIRKPLDDQQCIVTAQGRKNVRQPTGIVLQNCTITADSSLESNKSSFKTYLARPWKEYSRTVIMESYIDDVIQSQGYLPWNATFALETLFYTEFNNNGPSSSKDQRVKWPGIKQLTSERIQRFTATHFIDGDSWIPQTKVPYDSGLVLPPPSNDTVEASPVSQEEDSDFNRTLTQQQSDLAAALKSTPSPSPPTSSNESTPASESPLPSESDSPSHSGSPSPSPSESDSPSDSGSPSPSPSEFDSAPVPAPASAPASETKMNSPASSHVPAPASAPASETNMDSPASSHVPAPASAPASETNMDSPASSHVPAPASAPASKTNMDSPASSPVPAPASAPAFETDTDAPASAPVPAPASASDIDAPASAPSPADEGTSPPAPSTRFPLDPTSALGAVKNRPDLAVNLFNNFLHRG
ncbi:Pectinesterase [Heracleum sosnowskyi]|uniref:pectinesterase n=1 Tax=Heracleum sosnowskyi TaxID=360622 RepID=A0AAD8HQR4_9APIA|nr:Pectinesterase [Heracleum sosnowskyi]